MREYKIKTTILNRSLFNLKLFLTLTLMISITSLACSIGSSAVVATPTPSPSPFPTTFVSPTPIPSITPVPTVTSAPKMAMDQANAPLHNGYYLTAMSIYQSILTQNTLNVDPRLRTDASIGVGTAALRE